MHDRRENSSFFDFNLFKIIIMGERNQNFEFLKLLGRIPRNFNRNLRWRESWKTGLKFPFLAWQEMNDELINPLYVVAPYNQIKSRWLWKKRSSNIPKNQFNCVVEFFSLGKRRRKISIIQKKKLDNNLQFIKAIWLWKCLKENSNYSLNIKGRKIAFFRSLF